MSLWKLTPIDENSPHWRLSTYKGAVIVRAPDEDSARFEATKAFAIAAEIISRATLHNPWSQAALVACARLSGSNHAEDGPPQVLCP